MYDSSLKVQKNIFKGLLQSAFEKYFFDLKEKELL